MKFQTTAVVSSVVVGATTGSTCPTMNSLTTDATTMLTVMATSPTENCQALKPIVDSMIQKCMPDGFDIAAITCLVGEIGSSGLLPKLEGCFFETCKSDDINNIFTTYATCDKTVQRVLADPSFCKDSTFEQCSLLKLSCTMLPPLLPDYAELIKQICGTNVGKVSQEAVDTCDANQPTDAPVSAPTTPPVSAPTTPPVSAPTPAPVAVPTTPPVVAPTSPPTVPSGDYNCSCSGHCSAWADPHAENFRGQTYSIVETGSVEMYTLADYAVVVDIEATSGLHFITKVSAGGETYTVDQCNGTVGDKAEFTHEIESTSAKIYSQTISTKVSCHQGPMGCSDGGCFWYLNANTIKADGVLSTQVPDFLSVEQDVLGATGECFSNQATKEATDKAVCECQV